MKILFSTSIVVFSCYRYALPKKYQVTFNYHKEDVENRSSARQDEVEMKITSDLFLARGGWKNAENIPTKGQDVKLFQREKEQKAWINELVFRTGRWVVFGLMADIDSNKAVPTLMCECGGSRDTGPGKCEISQKQAIGGIALPGHKTGQQLGVIGHECTVRPA